MSVTTLLTAAGVSIGKKVAMDVGKKVIKDWLAPTSKKKKIGKLVSYRKTDNSNNVLLFVHGFSGSQIETFGATPEILSASESFEGWDIFSIGYSSDIFPSLGKGIWSANPNVTTIALYLKTLLTNQFKNYNRVAFVAHSMGGLAVQRVILDLDKSFREKISHVMFFGTPSAGLKKASPFWFWNRQLGDLSFDSPFIHQLRADWEKRFANGPHFLFKTIAGSTDEFVPASSSLAPFNEKYRGVIEGNHVTMIKPIDHDDTLNQSFAIIHDTLCSSGEGVNLKGDAIEKNILLGDYHKVVQAYYDNFRNLAPKQLGNLAFALECCGRTADALHVLKEYPNEKITSDILGFIGGRYKRKYLVDGLSEDAEQSTSYYQRGLSIAEERKDKGQIFYHAINLAFLNMITGQDPEETKRLSSLALENCNLQSNNLWEIATIAEANLYLENFARSEEYYLRAGSIAGNDLRARSSIYSNAFYGYQALTGSNNKNAEFLVKLDKIFNK